MERGLRVVQTRRSRRLSVQQRRQRAFARARALLIGALVLGFGASATVAAWTDDEFASSSVSAGTFSLVSRTSATASFAAHDTAAGAAVLPLNATNLYPGQSRAAFIQIKTTGTVPGSVQLSAVDPRPGTGANSTALRDALRVRIVASSAAGDTPAACTTGTTGGTEVGIAALPTLAAQPLQANGANTVTYCVIVSLPASAPSAAQGGTVNPVWTFTGTTG